MRDVLQELRHSQQPCMYVCSDPAYLIACTRVHYRFRIFGLVFGCLSALLPHQCSSFLVKQTHFLAFGRRSSLESEEMSSDLDVQRVSGP